MEQTVIVFSYSHVSNNNWHAVKMAMIFPFFFLRGNFPLCLFFLLRRGERDRRKAQCAVTVTSDQIFILMVRAGQPTCIFAQLLPKGYNRNCRCKEYVERRCQYPDNRIHVAQWTQQAKSWSCQAITACWCCANLKPERNPWFQSCL